MTINLKKLVKQPQMNLAESKRIIDCLEVCLEDIRNKSEEISINAIKSRINNLEE